MAPVEPLESYSWCFTLDFKTHYDDDEGIKGNSFGIDETDERIKTQTKHTH